MLISADQFLNEFVIPEDSLYTISNYQRFYVWDKSKVDTYLNDILLTIARRNNDDSIVHYFGQFIILKTETDRRKRNTYEVIDGQQRLTTFLMLVACLHGKSVKLAEQNPDLAQAATEFQNLCKRYLESNKAGATKKAKLELSEIDNTHYTTIIQNLCRDNDEKNSGTQAELAMPESHIRLTEAQTHIRERVNSLISSRTTAADKLSFLEEILKTATEHFQVVVLEPEEEKYTYQLYQVVNDRGEPLKDGELLKAKAIEVLAGNDGYLTRARNIWNDILKDPGKKTDEYLKWCYTSKLGRDKSQKGRYYKAFLTDYFGLSDYCEFSDEVQSQFMEALDTLHQDIKVCRKLEQGIWPYEGEDSTADSWEKAVLHNLIVGRKHTLCIPVLLSSYVQNKGKSKKEAEKRFFSYLETCETFFLLFKGVFGWREDKLKRRYLAAAKEMRDASKNYEVKTLRTELAGIEPDLIKGECLERLKSIQYVAKGDNTLIKHLCILLETYWGCFDDNGKVYTRRASDGTKLVYSELSIEHIYPESAPEEKQEAALAANKHRLGNLLLYGISDNSSLGNKSYELKRELYMKSKFATATAVANAVEHWTFEEYKKRHDDVCQKLEALLLRFYPDEKESKKKAERQSTSSVDLAADPVL